MDEALGRMSSAGSVLVVRLARLHRGEPFGYSHLRVCPSGGE
jgi:hypothetical protein